MTIENDHPDFSTENLFACPYMDGSCEFRSSDDSERDWIRWVRFRLNELRTSGDQVLQARYRYACPDENTVFCRCNDDSPWIGSPPEPIVVAEVELSDCNPLDHQGLCLEIWSEKIEGGGPVERNGSERFEETSLDVELSGVTCVGRFSEYDICVRNCGRGALPMITGLDPVRDSVGSPNHDEFIYVQNNCRENTILGENDQCCFRVEFSPEYPGPRRGSVVIDFEDEGGYETGIIVAMTGNIDTRNTEAGLINVDEVIFFEPMDPPDGNCTHEGELTISNVGCGDLHIDVPFQIEGNESFEDTVDFWPFGEDLTLSGATEVMEGGSYDLTLRYCPTDPANDREDGTLVIRSDDPENDGVVRVTLDNPNS
jgi:hypothetical protein